MAWQKRLRALLAAVVLLLGGGVAWYVTRDRPQAVPPPVSPRTDQKALFQESPGEQVRYGADGREVFRIKYDLLSFYPEESRMHLVKVSGTLTRGDQPVTFSAAEADVRLKAGAAADLQSFDEMRLRGNVLIKAGKELHLETSEATYNDVTGIMETDKPARIKRGHMSGSGTGATFDRDRRVVWLMANAKVAIATAGQGTLEVSATRAGLADAEHYMRFEENVRMTRGNSRIDTDAAVANLTPDGKGITSMELRGNSRITGSGAMPAMRADDITITYAADSGVLERTVLMRAAHVDLPEGGGRTLAAGYIDIGFGGDGSTVTSLDANDAVELEIPRQGDQPAREVRAPALEARGSVPKGLERAQFSGGVEFREQAPAQAARAAIDRVGRSETLVLAMDGGFGDITEADFSGQVEFRDGDVTATAPSGRYGVDTRRILLRGGERGASRVVQDDGTIDAKDIDLTLDPRKLAAKGGVGSTIKAGARKDRKQARPSILEDDEPVNVTSQTLDYDGVRDRAVYSGNARLWQGDTVIQAETIVLDDATGNVEARTKVRTLFIIREDPGPGGKPAPNPKPTHGDAEEFLYEESRRRATYLRAARLAGPEGHITADRIEVFLREDGNTLDRAEAYGTVTARLDGGRVATGERLTYNAKTRRYAMQGKPLTVRRQYVDKAAGGTTRCEKTTGASLTFDRSADTVSVVGANGAPSRTVPEPCTAGRRP